MNRFLARIALRGAGVASLRPPAEVAGQGVAPFEEVAVEATDSPGVTEGLTPAVNAVPASIRPPSEAARADNGDVRGKAADVITPEPAKEATPAMAPAASPAPLASLKALPASPLPTRTAVTPSAPTLRRSPLVSPAAPPAAAATIPRGTASVEASAPPAKTTITAVEVSAATSPSRRLTELAASLVTAEAAEPGPSSIEPGLVPVLRPRVDSMPPAIRLAAQAGPLGATARGGARLPRSDAEPTPRRTPGLSGDQPEANAGNVDGSRTAVTDAQATARAVEVHIGRIEVVQPASPSAAEPAPAARALGFDEYARARANGF